jgi:hypothetical protein
MTFADRRGRLTLPMVEKKKRDKLKVRYPAFGRRVDAAMVKNGLNNEDVAAVIGKPKGEMVRRYREGKAIPNRDETIMRKMATLFSMTPGELHYGDPKVPGVVTLPVANVSPDEQILLEAYRNLPKGAKKVLRVRATELLEELAPASPANPNGKGAPTKAKR